MLDAAVVTVALTALEVVVMATMVACLVDAIVAVAVNSCVGVCNYSF